MTYRILFVASLHHPEALREAIAQLPPGQPTPLFPPSMSQHFWEKALSKRGHVLEVFYRNLPGGKRSASGHAERHTQALTPRKIWRALMNRVPPEAN
ncbi:MAG: hypothetical protein L0Z53_17805, partial [Acidobacteriales bacterium]|nr:hypothetical protein [Terriglobales bacterium]